MNLMSFKIIEYMNLITLNFWIVRKFIYFQYVCKFSFIFHKLQNFDLSKIFMCILLLSWHVTTNLFLKTSQMHYLMFLKIWILKRIQDGNQVFSMVVYLWKTSENPISLLSSNSRGHFRSLTCNPFFSLE